MIMHCYKSNNTLITRICQERLHIPVEDLVQRAVILTIKESSNDLGITQKYRHLWVQCEKCYGSNYKKKFKSKMNIC